jgi:glycosyltransferase involved in cell wall biosynthesis
VTERALQERYPPAPDAFSTHYSSIQLHDDAFVSVPPERPRRAGQFTLLTVGTLEQLYKAPDVLLEATAMAVRLAPSLGLRLVLVGDGRYRPELEARVASLALARRVRFVGRTPAGQAVRDQLDQADLFVLPSRTEGLPKAMIEAMARGLPCIGSTVGGIPELLAPEDLVRPEQPALLAQRILEVAADTPRMACMAARNLQKAREYHENALRERRRALYLHLKERTQEWIRTRRA